MYEHTGNGDIGRCLQGQPCRCDRPDLEHIQYPLRIYWLDVGKNKWYYGRSVRYDLESFHPECHSKSE